MKHYSTLDYVSNEVSFTNFYKRCLEKWSVNHFEVDFKLDTYQ